MLQTRLAPTHEMHDVSPACGMPSASAMATVCKIYVLCSSKFSPWRSDRSATVPQGNLKRVEQLLKMRGATVEDPKSFSIWKGHFTESSGSTPMLASEEGIQASACHWPWYYLEKKLLWLWESLFWNCSQLVVFCHLTGSTLIKWYLKAATRISVEHREHMWARLLPLQACLAT